MTKRIISLVLSFLVVLTVFPAAVFAYDSSEKLPAISDLDYMKRLGVFPEDLVSGEALTRSDLARIYFRILVPTMADSEYVKVDKPFVDLGDEHFAVAFVAKAGIMSGVSETHFNPEGTVTYNQIAKTLVSFLGYDEAAKHKGGYPAGYNLYAARFGFADYASGDDYILTTDVAAALFKLAVDVPLADVSYMADGNTVITQGDENYLEKHLGIYSVGGVVSATINENIYETGSTTEYFEIKIEDDTFNLNQNTISIKEFIGYNVNGVAKYNADTKDYDLLYYELDSNKEYIAHSRDIIDYNSKNGVVTFYDEEDEKETLDISNAYIIYNGTLCESYDSNIVNPFADPTLDGKVIMVDNNRDKKIDVVLIEEYQSYVVKKIHNGVIYNKYHPSVMFDISKIEDGDIAVENVLGTPIPLSTITDGDIISVFTDFNGNIKKIIVSIDSYVGKVQEITNEGDEILKFMVDGNYFDCANRLSWEVKNAADVKIGDTVKFYFDFAGKVSNIETDSYSQEQYGFLIAADTETGFVTDARIKVLTAMDTMLITKLKAKTKLNGVPMDDENVLAKLGFERGVSNVKRQIIKYVYDKEKDCITEIVTVDENLDETCDGFYKYKNLTEADTNYYRASSMNFRAKLLLSSATPVFIVPEDDGDLDDESYGASDSTYFTDGSNSIAFDAYGTKAYSPTAEAIVVKTSSGTDSTRYKKTEYLIVNKCGQRLDEDESSCYISGFVNGAEVNYLIEDEALLVGPGGTAPEAGDVLHIGFDKKKKIVISEFIFDASERKLGPAYTTNPSDSNAFSQDRYLYGSVKYFNDSVVSLEMTDYAAGASVSTESYPITSAKVYEFITTGRTPTVVLSSTAALHDEYHNSYPANIFQYNKNIIPQFIIIFHE